MTQPDRPIPAVAEFMNHAEPAIVTQDISESDGVETAHHVIAETLYFLVVGFVVEPVLEWCFRRRSTVRAAGLIGHGDGVVVVVSRLMFGVVLLLHGLLCCDADKVELGC